MKNLGNKYKYSRFYGFAKVSYSPFEHFLLAAAKCNHSLAVGLNEIVQLSTTSVGLTISYLYHYVYCSWYEVYTNSHSEID